MKTPPSAKEIDSARRLPRPGGERREAGGLPVSPRHGEVHRALTGVVGCGQDHPPGDGDAVSDSRLSPTYHRDR